MSEDRGSYLYAGVRTPFGKYRGRLADSGAVQLAGNAIKELVRRHPAVAQPDGIIMGMTVQAGAGGNPARAAAHYAGLDLSIPAITLNNACLAGIDCMVDASRRIAGGEGRAYLVGGLASSSRSPYVTQDGTEPTTAHYVDGLICAIGGEHVGVFSDRRNRELGISRERQDEWSCESHRRAARASFVKSGEVFPFITEHGEMTVDESIRPDASLAALGRLKAAFVEGGTITAGNAPSLSDGAAIGIVGSREFSEVIDQGPLVRIVDWAYSAGPDWTLHNQPSDATRNLLKKQHLRTADIDLYEINEAFAGVVLAAVDDLKLPWDMVNPNGGAIAIGHPDAATAFRQVLTLALELNRRNLKRGIATLCGAGGQGIAILIESV
ncbi:thiolase family protein [Caballeronia cordobensis]|uniref:thiolase family protein n=1 Tax=Caballeronia cordobensis TaxID=1353886 RepID=UPI00045F0F01|nr:putative membrane protein [Burkholderia sp. RPE67]